MTQQSCPECKTPMTSRGGFIRVIMGKRDITSEVMGASWYCPTCDRVRDWDDVQLLGSSEQLPKPLSDLAKAVGACPTCGHEKDAWTAADHYNEGFADAVNTVKRMQNDYGVSADDDDMRYNTVVDLYIDILDALTNSDKLKFDAQHAKNLMSGALAGTDAADRLRWLLSQAERVVTVDAEDRRAVERACKLLKDIDNGFDRVRE